MFGRAPSCPCEEGNFFVINHPSLSRQHAVVIHGDNSTAYIVDLGSLHGTYLNLEQLQPYEPRLLENGNIVTFGLSSRQYVVRTFPKEETIEETSVCWTTKLKHLHVEDGSPVDSPAHKHRVKTAYHTSLNSVIAQSDNDIAAKIAASASPMFRPSEASTLENKFNHASLADTIVMPPAVSYAYSPLSTSMMDTDSEKAGQISLAMHNLVSNKIRLGTRNRSSSTSAAYTKLSRPRRVSFSCNEPELIGPSLLFQPSTVLDGPDTNSPPSPSSTNKLCKIGSMAKEEFSRPRFASHPVEGSENLIIGFIIQNRCNKQKQDEDQSPEQTIKRQKLNIPP